MTPRKTTPRLSPETTEKGVLKSVRFSSIEARLLEESAAKHNMSVSDVVRAAVIFWREHVGGRQGALDAWVDRLVVQHGPTASLTARVNDAFSLDVEVAGSAADQYVAEAVFDGRDQLQIWVGDPETDARVFLGRVRMAAGAAITIPLASLRTLGASDAHAV